MTWRYTIANSPHLVQTSTRNRDAGASFAARQRAHLSISDDSHHVTETIGFLYGDDDERDPRRVSQAPSIARSSVYSDSENEDTSSTKRTSFPRKPLGDNRAIQTKPMESLNARPIPHPSRNYSYENGSSPSPPPITTGSTQSPSETAQSQFPLNDIDYESSPAAVAQELSNLQALRRMSMDVHAAGDPDLPHINPATMPNAPSPTASEDDEARLFWVPARLHPELAPKEFKTFLESKAEQIKRRSGDLSSFTPSPMSSRINSSSSNSSALSRKKSMLSREVNSSSNFQDGADILERKRSMSHRHQSSDPNLAELESLVANNAHMQRPESPDENGDFILPSIPASSLKRSTKTKYQRGGGGIKARGERPVRGSKRTQTPDQDRSDQTSPVPSLPDVPAISSSFLSSDSTLNNLADTLGFSALRPAPAPQNFSRRPARSPSPPQETAMATNAFDSILSAAGSDRYGTPSASDDRMQRKPLDQPEQRQSIPQIIEHPPADESAHRLATTSPQAAEPSSEPVPAMQHKHPARTSSRESPPVKVQAQAPARPPMPRTHSSVSIISSKAPRADMPLTNPKQSLDQPSPLPGNDTNTSNLSFIPTLTVETQNQDKKEPKKSGWGWLLGKDDDKDKGKGKGKNQHGHDNTRLDVLQSSIDGSSKRRETIEIDRHSLQLEEERKKESQRKATSNDKKEKEGLFSSFFGGKKAKADKESKRGNRGLSPEPPYRELKPDIDYSWTRFSILEERAIYRMAHIKLANPRRPLYSQVLLSNFMYSYLAKVQQMHPQMNLPTSAKQQKKQKQQEAQPEPEGLNTYQRYQQVCDPQRGSGRANVHQQQESQQQSSSNAHQQQASHSQQQPIVYDGPYGSNGEQSNSRPSTRGSSRKAEGSQNGRHTNHDSYTYHRHQQPTQQYERDRESDMW